LHVASSSSGVRTYESYEFLDFSVWFARAAPKEREDYDNYNVVQRKDRGERAM